MDWVEYDDEVSESQNRASHLLSEKAVRVLHAGVYQGERLVVKHPEAVTFHEEVLVYRDTDATFILFDCDSVSRFIGREQQ